MNNDFRFEIVKHFGTLSTSAIGWSVELNLVNWNGKEPKYDLRSWDADHERMSRGITLTEDELKKLITILDGMEV